MQSLAIGGKNVHMTTSSEGTSNTVNIDGQNTLKSGDSFNFGNQLNIAETLKKAGMKEGTEEYINAMKAMGKIQQTKEQVEKNPLMTAFAHALSTGEQKKINELAKKINSNGYDNGNVMDTVIDELKDNWKTVAEIGGGYLLYRGAKSEFTNRVFNDKPGAPTKAWERPQQDLGK